MLIEVDFNSDEAIYIQLCNQIILGIAMSDIQEGDSLPSVRQLADTVGVNMHTARGLCKNISRQEVHGLVDEIFDEYELHENR